ncbi:MAG: hypothetical protein CML33_01395 [Rhodobacteraceae bacterium]|nr:hypothetical protein [Paracoccaceae bacterium]
MDQYKTLPKPVKLAIEALLANMEVTLPIPEVADEAGKTVRSLERLFVRHLNTSPGQFYRGLRLKKVRQLLWHTNLSVLDIAMIAGVHSPSNLSWLYQKEFGLKPSDDHKQRTGF